MDSFCLQSCYQQLLLEIDRIFEEFKKTVLISIPVVATIYLINVTINFFVDGSPANYWYLIKFPDGANLTAFMPDPPAHLPIFFVLGLLTA